MDAESGTNPGCLESLGKVAFMVAGFVFRAYAIVTLWRWFLVPLGLPAVGMWHLFGILSVLALLTTKQADYREMAENKMEWPILLNSCLLHPACALGVGYLYLLMAF